MTDDAWVRKDKYYQESSRYLVSAARVRDEWVFTAWRKPRAADRIKRLVEGIKGSPKPVALGHFDSAAEARSACERDDA